MPTILDYILGQLQGNTGTMMIQTPWGGQSMFGEHPLVTWLRNRLHGMQPNGTYGIQQLINSGGMSLSPYGIPDLRRKDTMGMIMPTAPTPPTTDYLTPVTADTSSRRVNTMGMPAPTSVFPTEPVQPAPQMPTKTLWSIAPGARATLPPGYDPSTNPWPMYSSILPPGSY